jgi:hypothetical protein
MKFDLHKKSYHVLSLGYHAYITGSTTDYKELNNSNITIIKKQIIS